MQKRPAIRTFLALYSILILVSGNGCSGADPDFAPGGEALRVEAAGVRVDLGPRQTLLESGALGLKYFPDEAVAIVGRSPTLRLLISAGDSSYVVEGLDITRLESSNLVLEPGAKGDFDSGYAGTSGVYRNAEGHLFAFYHAENHTDELPRQSWFYSGWYGAVGVAVSEDDGLTFRKLGPILMSVKPNPSEVGGESTWGVAAPGIVLDRSGDYLLAYYGEHSPGKGRRGINICMARADVSAGAPLPGRWMKYYEGRFEEPGISGRDTPILTAVDPIESALMQPHVVFSEAFDRYIMILSVAWWRETWGDAEQTRSGIHIAFSDDGIEWTDPVPLIIDHTLPALGKSISWQATILWDEGSSSEGWLVYSYSENWGPGGLLGTPHHMVGRRIALAPSSTGL